MCEITILILAAGRSRRMRGRDKLLEPVRDGLPLLAERAQAAAATGQRVLVALPRRRDAPARWACLEGSAASCVAIENAASGLSASLKGLIAMVPGSAAGALVLPADMPDITSADMAAVIAAFQGAGTLVRASTGDGRPGHPVLFGRDWFERLQGLSGDKGARDIVKGAGAAAALVMLPGENALTDLDTPQDWARWRARLPERNASP